MAISGRYNDGVGPAPLRQVRGFELLDEIEAGGMAHVYRARRLADGDIVAIKVVHIDNMAPDYEARLRREPEVQHGIGHDNIVRLEESFREHDEFFLVMEYVDGRSLARMLHTESGPLPFERARGYFRQVLRAVDHLHRVGIVHRDIKPSNILVRWDDVVKLADFGIAKFIWQEDGTATRQGLGTPQYMSPEQVSGGTLDQRTDIYSLGATFFEMLTARMPYSRDAATPMAYMQVIQDVLDAPLPDPRTYQPMIPPGAVRLIERATAKKAVDRFQNIGELAAALEAIGAEEFSPPTIAVGALPSEPAAARDRAVDVPSSLPRTPMPEREPVIAPLSGGHAARPGRWRPDRTIVIIGLLLLALIGVAGYLLTRPSSTELTAGEFTASDGPRLNALVKEIAGRYERGMAGCASDSVAALYAVSGVRYFNAGVVGRAAIDSELAGFCAGIRKVDAFHVDVDSVWLVDGAVESQWSVTSQRTLPSDTVYRDTATDMLRFEPRAGGWVIVAHRHIGSKHYSIAPLAKPRTPAVRQPSRPARSVTPARRSPAPVVVSVREIPKEIRKQIEKLGRGGGKHPGKGKGARWKFGRD